MFGVEVRSIDFDGVNSWTDFKLMIESAEIGYPKKNQISNMTMLMFLAIYMKKGR